MLRGFPTPGPDGTVQVQMRQVASLGPCAPDCRSRRTAAVRRRSLAARLPSPARGRRARAGPPSPERRALIRRRSRRSRTAAFQPTLETCTCGSPQLLARIFTLARTPQPARQFTTATKSRIAELLLAELHHRWQPTPEVAVRRPARGFVDAALFDPRSKRSSQRSWTRTFVASSRFCAGAPRRLVPCHRR